VVNYVPMNTAIQKQLHSRRTRFSKQLKKGVAILPGGKENDSPLPFRQESDFYYLTGLDEPGAVCVIHSNNKDVGFSLFVKPKNPDQEQWTGPRIGPKKVKKAYGADNGYSVELIEEILPELLKGGEALYYPLGRDDELDKLVLRLFRDMCSAKAAHKEGLNALVDPDEILSNMRWRKGREELAAIRRACRITSDGHTAAMKEARPGMTEQQVTAVLAERFYMGEAAMQAFPFIVASGPNATVLHYEKNCRRLREGDLLLIDAGAEYQHYAADLTRTFPVGSAFSEAQRELYEIVLEAQKEAIRSVAPGEPHIALHETACRIITRGLKKIGLLRGRVDRLIKEKEYAKFYPHNTSHWIGLDVHDKGPLTSRTYSPDLRPGVVLTVEPGIYVRKGDRSVPKQYRGLGIRIEDVVAVTRQGHRVLTSTPKEVQDIEHLRVKALS